MTPKKSSRLNLVNVPKLVMKETMLRYSQTSAHLIWLSRVREEQNYAAAYLNVSFIDIWHLRLYPLLFEHTDASLHSDSIS